MRSIEDKGCLNNNNGSTQEISMSFEFHKNNGLGLTRTPSHPHHHHRTALGKPTPSKWDDAQKWLVNLSRGGEKNPAKASPRNSNADDRRLIAPVAKKEYEDEIDQLDMDTKNVVNSQEEADTSSIWRINKHVDDTSRSMVKSICVRDMGTEMTPIASQEPSRTATPVRATTPISSGTSTPVRSSPDGVVAPVKDLNIARVEGANGENVGGNKAIDNQSGKLNPLESRALAWDEAERAKYMARYKREEVKIQAWENHQKRKAEMEMRKEEVKAERMKSRAQEKYANKVAVARRVAEEKRANAEAKLNEKGVKISEWADYIRQTGRLPSSFSFKMPSLCW